MPQPKRSRRARNANPPTAARRTRRAVESSPLGGQIRDLRAARGMSLAALAEAIGKSIGYVSQIERGRSEISISTLKAISEALGVQIS